MDLVEKYIGKAKVNWKEFYEMSRDKTGKTFKEYEKKYGLKPIEGTSDSLINSEHARLQKLASEYALKYNKVILNYKKD